ncbi:UDPglucose--hexose-1-phosphate uridylyltransferase [Methanohalophilus levihalophilus]|uniref:galactose-1-phosphate uridylyltransferase n=1 Tax=Methanohalophilus levihalophilus TaxID=1431282 RepID=UPI001AE14244|nr:DUF4931 domain-containing protein [Methanohalophilus levihalophilus]MBP2030680.1 UDPglucose--hexose-1-phosphate uridylyltransferase [Methanohalophilus levihalophilus]
MSEIRKHYFLDEYCIIASARKRRPSDFSAELPEKNDSKCVFCAGNEDKTPAATAVYKDNKILMDSEKSRIKDWNVRCIPNLYPALSPNPVETGENIDVIPGYGFHEVIVETPFHEKEIQDFSDEEINLLMQVYQDRITRYGSMDGIEYVSLFKNQGKKAGASLAHTHTQLIALPIKPPLFVRELDRIHALDGCPYCAILEKEISGERLLYENDHFIAIAPYFSRVPYELWILPKKHINHIAGFDEKLLNSLGDVIRFSISSLHDCLGGVAYNYMFYQLQDDPEYHFNLKLHPRTSIAAGFEKNTDIYINTLPPEEAVKHLKGEGN